MRLRAIGVGLGVIALLNLLIFVPVLNLPLVFVLAPLAGGYLSAKYGESDWKVGATIGVGWSIIQVSIFLFVLSNILPFLSIKIGFLEAMIIFLIFIFNTGFALLGNRIG